MSTILWVASLLVVGLAVIVLEVFVPSGGLLGFVSVATILTAVITAFLQLGTAAGLLVLAITVVAVPAALGLAFRWFPETPLGRRVLPPPPDPSDVLPDADRRRRLRDLVGRGGVALNELLPWGTVQVGDTLAEAMSESGPIAAGAAIEAVGVQGMALVVRRVQNVGPLAASAGRPAGSAAADRPAAGPVEPAPGPGNDSPGPRLSPTLESFDFEDLDPPRA
jgi:membrane-bound ClpP family serine protease